GAIANPFGTSVEAWLSVKQKRRLRDRGEPTEEAMPAMGTAGLRRAGAGGAAMFLLRGCCTAEWVGRCERETTRIKCAWDAGSSACLTRRNSAATKPTAIT